VVFRDGCVVAIDPPGSNSRRPMRSIDGSGHTLLPGLVDSHLHFSIPGGLPAADTPRVGADSVTARQLVRSGVTSGRLHLATVEQAVSLKRRSADACGAAPRLQVGGPGLSGAVEKDSGNFQGATSVEDASAKVERFARAGVDWIAIHDAERFPAAVLGALAATARRNGVRLMAGGSTAAEITAALTLAPDTLDYIDRTVELLYPTPVLDLMRRQKNLILVPTLGVRYRADVYTKNPELLEQPGLFQFLTPPERAFVVANARKDLAGADTVRALQVWPTLAGKLRQLRSLGLPVALGSDAGSPLNFQADAIWWELEAWRSTGVSHRDALAAATETGARVLGLTDVGHLDTGARADFVLYRGDVESGPFDATRVLAVAKSGVLYVKDGQWVGPEQ
jgi:hypothetical protein